MKVHHSPASLLRAQIERFRNFKGTQEQLHRAMVAAGVKDHRQLVSGSVSASTLRKLGHPFGRGSGGRIRGARVRSQIPRLPINRQTGRLKRSLRVSGPSGRDNAYSVAFTQDYAKFVLSPTGTKRMVARGFQQELKKRNAARLQGQRLRWRDAQQRS